MALSETEELELLELERERVSAAPAETPSPAIPKPSEEESGAPSQAGTAFRSAVQGATMGAGSKVRSALTATQQALLRKVLKLKTGVEPSGSWLEDYQTARAADEKQSAEDTAAWPKTAIAGEVAGSIASFPLLGEMAGAGKLEKLAEAAKASSSLAKTAEAAIPMAKQAKKIARLTATAERIKQSADAAQKAKILGNAEVFAKLGALQGLAGTKEDLPGGSPADLGMDVVEGAGAGAAGGLIMPAAAKVAGGAMEDVLGGAKKGIEWTGKKVLPKIFQSVSEEDITRRLANPERLANAKPFPQLAQDFVQDLKVLRDKIGTADSRAWQTLRNSPDPSKGAIPKSRIIGLLNQLRGELEINANPQAPWKSGGIVGPSNKQAAKMLNSLADDITGLAGVDAIPESKIKEIIQAVDSNINWADPGLKQSNKSLRMFRGQLDHILKEQNPKYEKAMAPVSEKVDLYDNLLSDFNIEKLPGEGLAPTNTTNSKLKTMLEERNSVTQERLAAFEKEVGRNYLEDAVDTVVASHFQSGRTTGSKMVNFGGGVGAAVGSFLGGVPGAAIGGTVGAAGGLAIDKEGGAMAGKIVDFYARSNPAKLGKWAPAFIKALKGESGNVMSPGMAAAQNIGLTHYVLMNTDPEYREHIKKLQEQSQGQTGQ